MSELKRCCRCRRDRELAAFGRDASQPSGLAKMCRDCRKAPSVQASDAILAGTIALTGGRALRLERQHARVRVSLVDRTGADLGGLYLRESEVKTVADALRALALQTVTTTNNT